MNSYEPFRLRLQQEYLERCRRNPRYSLRSFAKSLKINHGALSQILRNTRPLSQKSLIRLAKALKMGPGELEPFLALESFSARNDDFKQLSLDSFVVVSDWYHDAILELLRIKGFQNDSKWIARQLGITPSEAGIAVERLVRLELIEQTAEGSIRVPTEGTSTIVGNDFTAVAFRRLQKQLLEISIQKLESVAKRDREHCSMTMAMRRQDLPEAKRRIKEFRRELCGFLQRDGITADHVYQLSVGLFPLTQIEEEV